MNPAIEDVDYIRESLPAFISEAREQIESYEQLLLELEDAPSDRELLDALFRCAHTIKGSAGIFGLDDVVDFTHHVETLLDRVREGHVALTPSLSTLLLMSNDQIRGLVEAAANPGATADAVALALRAALVTQLQQASGAASAADEAQASKTGEPGESAPTLAAGASRIWRIAAKFGSNCYRDGMDPLAILNYLRGMGDIVELACDLDAVPALDAMDAEDCHLGFALQLDTGATREEIESAFVFVREECELAITPLSAPPVASSPAPARLADGRPPALTESVAPVSPRPPAAPAAETATAARAGNAPRATGDDNRYIRVHADRLDAVINLLGELVIAGAGAALMARQTRQRALIEVNQQMGRLIEEIRNGTLQLRMVPIGETFSRFRRLVRDTAAELGKDVALDISGGETEMDKSVVERIADPLTHLVRNGLDHGLEPPEERIALGKPAQGRLSLSARHEAGGIVIQIQDDGRGIHRQRVLQRAWDRGLLPQGVVPPDADILNLIFEPGFSTAEKVTNLSGRGVGMDVVRRNIQALRGSVTLHSVEGQGSAIEIRLPLTLAIIDGFLVGVGSSRFIFPLETVVEVIETQPDACAQDARGRAVIELRGQVMPVVNLCRLYGLEEHPSERGSVVVLQAGQRRFGVMVDQLLGQHQTVIKPLGRLFGSLRGMSGSSILGNGEVALIFDVNALCQLAADAAVRAPVTASRSASISTPEGLAP